MILVPNHAEYTYAWTRALAICADYLHRPQKVDPLMQRYLRDLPSFEHRRAQYLVMGVVRHRGRLDWALDQFLKKRPKDKAMALLLLAGFELLEATEDEVPQVISFAVDQSKRELSVPESRMVNAVLRKAAPSIRNPGSEGTSRSEERAIFYSHPHWLVEKWMNDLGEAQTDELLAWDQKPGEVYVRVEDALAPRPDGLEPTEFEGFLRWTGQGNWDRVIHYVEQKHGYIQDPSTRLPVKLLEPRAGEKVLDLCAAPGGKSRQILPKIGEDGLLVSVDLPGQRARRLKENLDGTPAHVVEADVLELSAQDLQERDLPTAFDAVLIDVPCSNTGVLQRRPDVKWRLQPGDIARQTEVQRKLLERALQFVKPGGRLLYSTCSLEKEENLEVAADLLRTSEGRVELVRQHLAFPPRLGHDGGGYFLFRKLK